MDWREWFKKTGGYSPKLDRLSNGDGGNITCSTDFWEHQYQAFKARLLEETTATEIPEGNRVKS